LLKHCENARAKRKGRRAGSKLNQTEMFIGDLSANYCVDLFFEKCILRAASGASSIGSRIFLFVIVDDLILERHS